MDNYDDEFPSFETSSIMKKVSFKETPIYEDQLEEQFCSALKGFGVSSSYFSLGSETMVKYSFSFRPKFFWFFFFFIFVMSKLSLSQLIL